MKKPGVSQQKQYEATEQICMIVVSFLASDDFSHLQITFANSLDADQLGLCKARCKHCGCRSDGSDGSTVFAKEKFKHLSGQQNR